MYRQLRATNYINFDHVYKRENELSAKGREMCVIRVVCTTWWKVVSTAKGCLWPKITNFGNRKETWDERRQIELEDYMALAFNKRLSAIINKFSRIVIHLHRNRSTSKTSR